MTEDIRKPPDLRAADQHRELSIAYRLATALNERDGTDLYVEKGKVEPEDAVLLSKSDNSVRIPVQVVSAPGHPHIRADHNYRKFEYTLSEELRACGIHSGHFAVGWNEDAIRSGLRREQLAALAKLISDQLGNGFGSVKIRSRDRNIYAENRWMTGVARWVNASRWPEFTRLSVTSPTGLWMPTDGRWVEDAVWTKVSKYGHAGCSGVVLIVDGGIYIDSEQVVAFARTFTQAAFPFQQLWIAIANAIVQLK